MRYWWVNHKQTSRHEIAGGFLWSPMFKANGARNHFYDNMRIAAPGDAVISFSHAEIRHVGLVTDFATPAPKPPAFGFAGEYWNDRGWLLPVKWEKLNEPVRPKERITEFRDMLPTKYSPVHPLTGNGGQNAYLAEIGRPVFELLINHPDLKSSSVLFSAAYQSAPLSDIDSAIEVRILTDRNLDSTTKQRLVDARRGQGVFKERIYEFERACRLTQVTTAGLLVASHIKPWRLCSTAVERLDGANGLLLTPHVDRLFDRGMIAFENDGKVKFSSRISSEDLGKLGLQDPCKYSSRKFHHRQAVYLEFHRDNVFLS